MRVYLLSRDNSLSAKGGKDGSMNDPTSKDRRRTAFHESSHAAAAWMMGRGTNIRGVLDPAR
jgi:hypothetical protein